MDVDEQQENGITYGDEEQRANPSDEEGEDLENRDVDSSEEDEEDDEEEARKIAEGFIVDEDEEEDDEEERRRRRKERRKRRKEKERQRLEETQEGLDEDDLDLLEENTGRKIRTDGPALKRLRRHRSPVDDEEDLQEDLADLIGDTRSRQVGDDLTRIFSDEEEGTSMARRAARIEEDDMADFIEEDYEDEEVGGPSGDDVRARQERVEAARARQKAAGSALTGIDREIWEEINEIFDTSEYDAALEYDDQEPADKKKPVLSDIFEPSEIKERHLTEADEAIRALDIPERMQIASAGISSRPVGASYLEPEELDAAAEWVARRISTRCTNSFIGSPSAARPLLHREFIESVRTVLEFLAIQFFEVPFIWFHRRDFIVHNEGQGPTVFLAREDLWKVDSLLIRYRALLERKSNLRKTFDRLQIEDDYFEELYARIQEIEEVGDLNDWLNMKYGKQIKEAEAAAREAAEEGGEVDGVTGKGYRMKRAARDTRYDRAKAHYVSKLAETIAISPQHLAHDFAIATKTHFIDDPDNAPLEFAERFADPNSEFPTADTALTTAKMILVQELSRDPHLKKQVRDVFKESALVSVKPTEKGLSRIDETHPYNAFKYLADKPRAAFEGSSQFLQILAAEADFLVTVSVHLPPRAASSLEEGLGRLYSTDYTSAVAQQWNDLRREVLHTALNHHLLPAAGKWMRDFLKEEQEEFVLRQCGESLEQRIDVAPYRKPNMERGEVSSVMAISHGHGDPKRDSTFAVFLDDRGIFREHLKVDNLMDPEPREELSEFIRRRRPGVIVLGGFGPSTHNLMKDVRIIAGRVSENLMQEPDFVDLYGDENERRQAVSIDCIFVHDDVARMYQQSRRAATEFPDVNPLIRYCVALARYTQSPLNEYAALDRDITALKYNPAQEYVNKEKLLLYLERAMVDVVAGVGVDLNRCVHDKYYAAILPYVSGMGPRKAQGLIKGIVGAGGSLVNRTQLVQKQLVTKQIFYNCAAFFRFDAALEQNTVSNVGVDDQPEILDTTRIHPEEYHIARKMASDALDLDEEEVAEFEHPSNGVTQVMVEDNKARLDELGLDDYAAELKKISGVPKLLVLHFIRDEMQDPWREKRREFRVPPSKEVFTMLTGETPMTLELGFIIPVVVVHQRQDGGLGVRLDSGIDGIIKAGFIEHPDDPENPNPRSGFPRGKTVQAQVIDIDVEKFLVELNTQRSALAGGDADRRRVRPDQYYDVAQAALDKEHNISRSKKGQGTNKRVIKHPNFQNMNSGQAEQYLANMQRGDCVIRPSSRGLDHLAVTWKVDTDVYQHIDVLEMDKPNEFQLGRTLKIGKYTYSDLDELIVSHVRAMARKVEEMMAHERYKGDEDALAQSLTMLLMADPNKSVYGFGIDKKKPGMFLLGFRANQGSRMETWPVKIIPGAFSLNNVEAGDMNTLCNAFKTQYAMKSAGMANPGALSSRTPYGAGTGRTPMYGAGRSGPTPNPYGGMTPSWGAYGAGAPQGGSTTPWMNGGVGITAAKGMGTTPRAPAYGYR